MKLFLVSKNLALRMSNLDLGNGLTGTKLVSCYRDTALRFGRYLVANRSNQLTSFAATVLTPQRAAPAPNTYLPHRVSARMTEGAALTESRRFVALLPQQTSERYRRSLEDRDRPYHWESSLPTLQVVEACGDIQKHVSLVT